MTSEDEGAVGDRMEWTTIIEKIGRGTVTALLKSCIFRSHVGRSEKIGFEENALLVILIPKPEEVSFHCRIWIITMGWANI